MSNYRVIYPNGQGGIAIVSPALDVSQEQVLNAVPTGKPYLIVSDTDLPSDTTFRDAWTADFTNAPVKY